MLWVGHALAILAADPAPGAGTTCGFDATKLATTALTDEPATA